MMERNNLNIATLNINGMKALTTQNELKNMLNTYHFDTLFLQKTHVDSMSLANALKDKYNYETFWSLGSNRSSGVAIFVSSKLNFTVEKFEFDVNGRFLFLDLLIDNVAFRLINVYAPNKECERKDFFNDLPKYVVCNRNIIMGGDFNCVLNPKYDKMGKGANLDYGTVGSKELTSLCNDYSLVDIFRHLFPYRYAATWHSPVTKDIHTRLDRFYISRHLINKETKFDFYPFACSDHDIFVFSMEFNKSSSFGPSYWKFNDSLLQDKDFVETFRLFYTYHTENKDVDLHFWDTLKDKIKNFCILYSKNKSKENFQLLRKLNSEYSILAQCEKQDPGKYFEQLETLRIRIKTLHDQAYFGSRIRSKVEILEDEEKPSNYFNKMEKRHAKKKTINTIEHNGQKFTETKDILNCFRDFYIDLFSYESIDDEIAETFMKDLPHLSEADSESLESSLSLNELFESLQHMQDGKSPGSDGLTKAFYMKFFDLIGPTLTKLTNVIFNHQCLTESQRLSYITLLCKDEQNSHLMKNWRPISLLNYDYKIISKSITNRLSAVIETIVHEDQTCSVKGRSIFDNVHLLRNIIDYVNQKDLPCIFLSLDQEKAFDRVSYDFLFKCLHTFGFGDNFIRWIKILYTNIQSSVIVNNFISSPFAIQRGVRQGCALSPLLYVLCLEPFANKVRLDPSIKGISLPGSKETSKLILYADDSNFTLSDNESVCNVLKLSRLFGKASGAKLNMTKTKGMFLGKWKTREDHPFGISWIDSMKLLGTKLGNMLSDDEIWFSTFSKLQKLLNNCKTRKLSLRMKSYVINCLACSKLWYLGSTTIMPGHYLKLFRRCVFEFLWNSKSEHLSRDTMYLHFKLGGQNIVNIDWKLKTLLLKHVQSLIAGNKAKWTYFAIYWIGMYLRKYNSEFASLKIPHSDYIPPFYKKCLEILREFESLPNVLLGNLSCKEMYTILLNSNKTHPRIESVHTNVSYPLIWKSLNNKFLDPFARDVSWKIAHEIIPVQQLLCKYKISKVPECSLCNFPLESIEHLFYSCPMVTPVYEFITDYLSAAADVLRIRILPSVALMLYHIIPVQVDKYAESLILYLLTECKFAIWMCRNLKKFESRRINSNYIILFILNRIKLRIQADFKRMNRETFSNYWLRPTNFCELTDIGELDFFI